MTKDLSALDYGHFEGDVNKAIHTSNDKDLILDGLPISIDIPNITELPNEEYAMLRKQGFGASDSSILLGVNPFKNLEQLIQEKLATTISEEEKAIGQKDAVRKGRDLEPLIIKKYQDYFGVSTMKPPSQYVFNDYPWLKINFDGVTDTPEQYIPVEIKVATYKGIRYYNPVHALFNEFESQQAARPDISNTGMSLTQKAEYYGIPVYYYTQLQNQMMGLNAPYGYLATLFETTWTLHVFFIWRDAKVQNEIVIASERAWREIERRRRLG